jgi:phosphopantothenoylcysteine decarboxylase/phosphopantothenate--cysteine ligase
MKGREVLIAVTGGIAAYKAASLVSQLVQAGAGVSVIMTRSGTKLVAPKTFEALSGRPVVTAVYGRGSHLHIEVARKAEVLCVAPATANIVAKAAIGLADEIVSTVLLSFAGPTIFAPAMNVEMWAKPPVQRNIAQLRADGILVIDPEVGHLSCGEVGAGRMAEPDKIFQVIAEQLAALDGKRSASRRDSAKG